MVRILLILFSWSALACSGVTYYQDQQKQMKLELQYLEGMKVGECKSENCDAVKIIKSGEFKSFKSSFKKGETSPSINFCNHLKGKVQVIYDQDSNDYSICRFKDESYAFAWDLLHKWRKSQ